MLREFRSFRDPSACSTQSGSGQFERSYVDRAPTALWGTSVIGQIGYVAFEPVFTRSAATRSPVRPWSSSPVCGHPRSAQGLRNEAAVFGQLFPGNQGTLTVSTPSLQGVTYTCLTVVGNTREVTCIWQGQDAVLSGVGVGLGTDETAALTGAARAGMHLGQ